jgi:hypothetical protein
VISKLTYQNPVFKVSPRDGASVIAPSSLPGDLPGTSQLCSRTCGRPCIERFSRRGYASITLLCLR